MNKTSLIEQRGLVIDTKTLLQHFATRFRQDMDVIMIERCVTKKLFQLLLPLLLKQVTLLSTLHTNSAAQTVDRIIDSFQGSAGQIRAQLASSLIGIFFHSDLFHGVSGGMIPAMNYSLTLCCANLIREGRTRN